MRLPTLVATGLLALALPAVADAQPATRAGSTTAKTCKGFGGGDAGDVKTVRVGGRRYTVICADDGRWYQVAARTAAGTARPGAVVTDRG